MQRVTDWNDADNLFFLLTKPPRLIAKKLGYSRHYANVLRYRKNKELKAEGINVSEILSNGGEAELRRALQARKVGRHALKNNQEEAPELDANTELAIEILNQPPDQMLSLREIYKKDRLRVPEIQLEVVKDSFKTQFLNEILIGNDYSDIEFLLDVIDNHIEDDTDLIVVSGIMQGDFKMVEKRRKGTLKAELSSMDSQFSHSREILRALSEKSRVIYNMGNDDMRICEDYTLEYFRKMFDLAKSADSVNYYQQDKIKQHPLWQEHLSFQVAHAFPYCLRSGRRLRSAEEIAQLSEGEIEIEEYMMLYDTVKRLERGEEPNEDYAPYLDLDCLGNTDFEIVDDFNLNVKTNGSQHGIWVRHHLNFSPQPMYGAHMQNMTDRIGEMASRGRELPYMMVTQHNLEEIGVFKDGCWALSGGGFIDSEEYINAKGRKTNVPGDPAKRLNTTRRRASSPSAASHERFDDGRHIVTIYNETLLQKANSCPETAVISTGDWQDASLTARPDYLVKKLDYIQRLNKPQHWYFNGDFNQGRNYPNFPMENQRIGLISLESQQAFTGAVVKTALFKVGNIEIAYVMPGNHEWNSGTLKWHGDSFTRFLRDVLNEKGVNVNFGEALVTPKGEMLKTYAAIDYVGEYGILTQHQPAMKGAKGAGGLPVMQFDTVFKGLGELARSIDIAIAQHWHHAQYTLLGDKLAVINGSVAGQSGYEWERGYRPVVGGSIIHIGGGKAPQIEFLTEEFFQNYEIPDGPFSIAELAKQGYVDDEDFDPSRHGIHSPRKYPKSALQKCLLDMIESASEGEYTRLK